MTDLAWNRNSDGTYTATGTVVAGATRTRRYWRITKTSQRRWDIHSVLAVYQHEPSSFVVVPEQADITYHGDSGTLGQAKDFIARADAFLANA